MESHSSLRSPKSKSENYDGPGVVLATLASLKVKHSVTGSQQVSTQDANKKSRSSCEDLVVPPLWSKQPV